MKISSIRYYLYDTIDWGILGRQMLPHLREHLPHTDGHGRELLQELERCVDALLDVYGDDTRKNPFTQKTKNADKDRDKTIRRIKKVLGGTQHHFEDTIKDAASVLYGIFEKHRFGRTKGSYEVQTATMEALLHDLATEEMRRHAGMVGIQGAIELLRAQQDRFEEMAQKKRDFSSQKKGNLARRLTIPIRHNCTDFVNYLNSRQRLHPSEYDFLARQIDVLITERNRKARARRFQKQKRKNQDN